MILSRHYTQPIHQVVDAAKRVGAGDLNQSIPVKSRDEIGELSETFNFMVRKLKESRTLEERLREAEHLSALVADLQEYRPRETQSAEFHQPEHRPHEREA